MSESPTSIETARAILKLRPELKWWFYRGIYSGWAPVSPAIYSFCYPIDRYAHGEDKPIWIPISCSV